MPYDPETGTITWRIHLTSSPACVFETIASGRGRARFWAESADETDGVVNFRFPNGMNWDGQILSCNAPDHFSLDYFGNQVDFIISSDGQGGTDLTLVDHGNPEEDRNETLAGWVSVLLALKATVDFGVDIRNHDRQRTWDHGYVDN
jgi:uncharacterized protein YndB with AHSA1/START domain